MPFSGNARDVWQFNVNAFGRYQDFMDTIWSNADGKLPAYQYGVVWELRNKATGEVVKDSKGETGVDLLNRGEDGRPLDALGIKPGMVFEVVRLASRKRSS